MNDLFTRLEREMHLLNRLYQHGVKLAPGETTSNHVRAAILEVGLEAVIAGVDEKGKPLNYAQVFEQVYAEPLIAKTNTRRKVAC